MYIIVQKDAFELSFCDIWITNTAYGHFVFFMPSLTQGTTMRVY